ncbi:unnamed protein product [Larinioides sclopetarius]|uniref:Uncharacterized protein n=1 Tax=Larinioides sclopetarius TaxID=280406 RepID=A0AAV2BPA6_9ARAC
MGKKDRNRRKSSQKPDNSKTKTIAPSTSNTKEVKTDGKRVTKDSHRGSDEIQAAGNFPRIVTEEVDCKEGRKRFTKDSKVEEQRLKNEESDMEIKKIEEMLYSVNGSIQMTMESIFLTEHEEGSSLLSEKLWDCDNYLKSQHPKVFENMLRYISLKEEQLYIHSFPNMQKKLGDISRSEAFMVLRVMEEDQNDEEMMLASAKVEDDDNETTTDLEREDGKQIEMNDGDDIQRATESVQKEGEKDSNGITGNIQETENCSDDMGLEFDDKAVMKIIDATDENMGKAKDCSKFKHANEMLNLYPRQNKYKENLLPDFQLDLKKHLSFIRSKNETEIKILRKYQSTLKTLKEMQDMCSLKKEITERYAELEEIKESNEKAHQIHEIAMKNIDSYKKEMELESSNEYIEVSDQSPLNASEKGKRGKEIGRPNDDIQDSHSTKEMLNLTQETEDCDRKDNTTYPNETNILSDCDFKNDLKEFLTLQKSKFDEQAKKYRDIELEQIFTKETRDISSEKEHLTDAEKTASHEATGDAKNNEDENTDELVTAPELDEPNGVVVDLDKNDCIHFEFETDDDKHIFAGNQYYYYSLNDNRGILFNYKDESIQICFTGNQIVITTEDSEFNISIQKANSVDLTDVATQTNTQS